MSVSLGTAYVTVEPDFDNFHSRVNAAMPTLTRRMQGLTTSTDRAHTTTSRFASATAGLGSALTGAAAAAGAALAAYLSISQAKAAISTTTDLAKVTAGLSRNLGLSTKAASRWGAVAYAREIDTKSLTMSFTTLSRQLTEASRGSDTATQAFKDIGITQRDLKSTNGDFQKQLMLVAEGFGAAEGGAKRQQAAQKLLGRGYQTLLPLFAEGRDSLKEQLHWADKYGVTLDKKTTKSVMDFVSAQRESRVAWLGLQKNFSVAVLPLLKDAQKEFQRISHILTNPDLSAQEKWEKVMKRVSHVIKKWAPKIGKASWAIGKAIAEGIFEGFKKEAPQMGVDIANALLDNLEGAYNAVGDLWNPLPFVPDLPTVDLELDNPLTKQKGALNAYAKTALKAVEALKHVQDAMDATGKDSDKAGKHFDKGRDKLSDYGKGARDSAQLASRSMGDHALKIDKYSDYIRKDLDRGKDKARDYADGTGDSYDKSSDAAKRMAKRVGGSAKSLADAVRGGMENIAENTNEALKGFNVKKLSFSFKNVGGAASDLGGFQTGGVIVPGRGTGDIFGPVGLQPGSVVVNRKATAAMLEPGEMVLDPRTVAKMGGASRADRINKLIPRFAKGGKVGGMSAMLSLANAFERADEPYLYGGGHGSFATSPIPIDCSGAVSAILHAGGLLAGAPMTSGSLMNWGKPGKGAVTVYANPGHTVMSLNGKTFGTSRSNPNSGAGWIGAPGESLAPGAVRTMDVAGAIASEIARVVLRGPDGPLKDIGQKALDRVRGAANKYIASKMPTGSFGGGDAGDPIAGLPSALRKYNKTYPSAVFPSAAWYDLYQMPKSPIAALAEWAGAGKVPGWTMEQVQEGEGTFRPGSRSSDGGYGLWAITKPYGDSYMNGLSYGAMNNPVLNAQVMARMYQAQGIGAWYGTGHVSDWNKHYSGHLLQRGGIIGLQKGGRPDKPIHGEATPGGTDPDFKRLSRVRRILKRIAELVGERGKAARLEETIGRVESYAGLESSPMGSDLSPAELARQIALNEKLLETLVRARKLTHSGLHLANLKPYSKLGDKQFKGVRTNLGQTMLDLAGLTGKAGRIGDVKLHLAELGSTATGATTAPLDISGLRSVIEAARYGAFDSQLPRFHEGGTFRAPAGRREGAAILSDGERVSPPGAGVVVHNNFDFEGLDLIVTTTVNGEIAKRERLRHNRARQYQR